MVGNYINNIGPPVSNSKSKDFVDTVLNNNLEYNPEKIESIGETNKLSLSYKIDNKYIAKVVTLRHLELQRLFSHFWNITVFPNSNSRIFGTYETPKEMVDYEYNHLNKMSECDINVPEPILSVEYNKTGILIIEYINNTVEYGHITTENTINYSKKLYETVKTLHKNNLGHGDIQQDNILIHRENLYLIDPTYIIRDNINYKIYDIACALATTTTKLDYQTSIKIALDYFSESSIRDSIDYIPYIMLQLGYDFNIIKLRSALNEVLD